MSTSQFARPSKTKSLFSQIDSQRPANARTRLGGIEGSQAVTQGQIAGQKKETADVQGQQQQMVVAGQQGRDSTSNLAGFGKAQAVFAEGTPQVAAGVPKFQDAFKSGEVAQTKASITGPSAPTEIVAGPNDKKPVNPQGGIYTSMSIGTVTPGGQNAVNGYGFDAGQAAAGIGTGINARNTEIEEGVIRNADGTVSKIGDIKLGDELSAAYGDASKTLNGYQNQITKGNLGVTPDESDFEMEQAKLAQVLADRQSNVGKLKALYGVGYDSTKYGALDSNVLQGQFNDASVVAKNNIEAKDMAQKEGARVREAYLGENATQVGKLNETKVETEKRIVETDNQLGTLRQQLDNLKTDTSNAAKLARGKITAEIQKLDTARTNDIKRLSGEVGKKRERNKLAGEAGLSDKEAQGLNDYQMTLVRKILELGDLTNSEKPGLDAATYERVKRTWNRKSEITKQADAKASNIPMMENEADPLVWAEKQRAKEGK